MGLNVIATAGGAIDLNLPIFQSGEVLVLVVTTQEGAQRMGEHARSRLVQVEAVQQAGSISARAVLEAASPVRQSDVMLVEGGPQLAATAPVSALAWWWGSSLCPSTRFGERWSA